MKVASRNLKSPHLASKPLSPGHHTELTLVLCPSLQPDLSLSPTTASHPPELPKVQEGTSFGVGFPTRQDRAPKDRRRWGEEVCWVAFCLGHGGPLNCRYTSLLSTGSFGSLFPGTDPMDFRERDCGPIINLVLSNIEIICQSMLAISYFFPPQSFIHAFAFLIRYLF